jgi:UDP-N-acetylmuramoylalanine--D-glutamate ligase
MSTPVDSLIVVVGLGRSGIGAARVLRSRGARVLVLESKATPELEAVAAGLRADGIEVALSTPLVPASFEALSVPVTAVVVSPGIAWDHPTLVELRKRGVEVRGEVSVAWEASRPVPWIGITGTNGKTTVTHLVGHLLAEAGIAAPIGGNVGRSAAEITLEWDRPGASPPEWMVVELSSYQIEASPELAPRIGLWTTLTPDHLERHGTLDNYRAIKRSLLERSEVRVLNADDPDLRAHARSWDRADWITTGDRHSTPEGIDPLLWIEDGIVCEAGGPLFPAGSLAMPGDHNRQNLLMAAAVGLKLGLNGRVMEAAFRSFPGVPHRLERIRELAGITWYNDSKATNYDAAEVALGALPGPLVVLAGGQAKQGDASAWLEALQCRAPAVVLFGAARAQFSELLQASGYGGKLLAVEGLAEAVPAAASLAAELTCPAVLLSPACASFDQYSDFEARGDHFRALVEAL